MGSFMKKHGRKLVADSVFVRTLITLLALLFLLLISFWGVLNRMMKVNYEHGVQENSRQVLKQTSEMTELALHLLSDDLSHMIWEDTILSYLIAPQSRSSQEEYEVLLLLNRLAQRSDLVETAWLYAPEEKWVLASDGFAGLKDEYEQYTMLKDYIPSTQISDKQLQDADSRIFIANDNLYIAVDFVLTKHIGSLFLQVNLPELYEMVNAQSQGEPIYYLDQKGEFFAPESEIEGRSFLSVNMASESTGIVRHGKEQWCYQYNEKLQWIFLQKMDTITQGMIFREYIPIVIPGLLIFLTLGILGAYAVTRKIYKPINQLVGLVLMYGEDREAQKNEWSYLKLSFMQTMDEKKMLKNSIKFWENDILEQVFRKLLQGSAPEEIGMNMLDPDTKAIWKNGRQYQVVVCQKSQEAKATNAAELDSRLFVQSIEQIVKKNKDFSGLFVVPMDQDFVAIMLTDSDKSAVQLKKAVFQLETEIFNAFRASAFAVSIDHGRVYAHWEDLIYSWQEGVQNIRYNKYLKCSPDAVSNESMERTELNREQQRYLEERAHQILDHLLKEQQKQAENLLERISDEIMQSSASLEQKKNYFDTIEGVFLEKRLTVSGQEKDSIEDKRNEFKDDEDLRKYMVEYLKLQMEQILRGTRKNSYRYVESARQYIQENCSDSGLSSQMVAEYLHINTSYFSEIFNKQMQESFSSYLNRIRIDNARKLLLSTKLPVYDIGFKCGFTTVQHFNRMFKKYTGMTPKQYRDTEST